MCATRAELDTHGRRLLTAQIVAVACFILFPLRACFIPGGDFSAYYQAGGLPLP